MRRAVGTNKQEGIKNLIEHYENFDSTRPTNQQNTDNLYGLSYVTVVVSIIANLLAIYFLIVQLNQIFHHPSIDPQSQLQLSNKNNTSVECKQILWVMGLSWHQETIERVNQIKYAVTTQKLRAPSLLPMLMYDGPKSNPFLSWLQANGVIICNMQPSITQSLEDAYMNKQLHGIYYRMVLNEFIDNCFGKIDDENSNAKSLFYETVDSQFVLYTDSDVGFFQDIDSCNIVKPNVISFGAEFSRNNIENTGVLIFNLPEYLKYQKEFLDFCKEKQWKAPTWDQEFYLEFFRDRNLVDQLPDSWNWKPYWGYQKNNSEITILHFHGPKPGMKCLDCLLEKRVSSFSKTSVTCEDCNYSYEEIFSSAKSDGFKLYSDMVREWKSFVMESAPYYDYKNKELVM